MTTIIRGFRPPPGQRTVPLTGVEAWTRHGGAVPHVFDRMWLTRAQHTVEHPLMVHPHGVVPPDGDWLSLPIVNLAGGGLGERPFSRWTPDLYRAGHFWRPRFSGARRYEEYVLAAGKPVWRYIITMENDLNGTLLSFRGMENAAYNQAWLDWLGWTVPGYTGVVGFNITEEVIFESDAAGRTVPAERVDRVTDVNFHPNPDFLTFYGPAWLAAVEQLCGDPEGGWPFPGGAQSAVVFPIRTPRDRGDLFDVDLTMVNKMDCELVALHFTPGESVLWQASDEWTWHLATVGSIEEAKAEAAAAALAEAITVAGSVPVPRMMEEGKPE